MAVIGICIFLFRRVPALFSSSHAHAFPVIPPPIQSMDEAHRLISLLKPAERVHLFDALVERQITSQTGQISTNGLVIYFMDKYSPNYSYAKIDFSILMSFKFQFKEFQCGVSRFKAIINYVRSLGVGLN